MSDPQKPTEDCARRFLFEHSDVRGELVQLGPAYREVVDSHAYTTGVRRLLGEFLAAAVLLSTTLKFNGRLTLQARSSGELPLIMAECTSALEIRGIARGAEQARSGHFRQLLADGQLAITVEPSGGKPYQGIVPLDGLSLGDSLDNYFMQSEQLPSRFWLASDGMRAAGLLLQQLPARQGDADARACYWEHLQTLSATLTEAELLALPADTLLQRLYHEEQVRLFAAREARFACSCSRERSRAALATLGHEEILDILREQGSVTMDCEFCNQRYTFTDEDLLPAPSSQHPLH